MERPQNGEGVVIVDAGGGTIDISSYSRDTLSSKPMFEEVSAPQCLLPVPLTLELHLILD